MSIPLSIMEIVSRYKQGAHAVDGDVRQQLVPDGVHHVLVDLDLKTKPPTGRSASQDALGLITIYPRPDELHSSILLPATRCPQPPSIPPFFQGSYQRLPQPFLSKNILPYITVSVNILLRLTA